MTIEHERITLEEHAHDVRSRLEARITELGRRVEETKQAVDLARVVREHPAAAAGIALGAGALIALVFGGKRGPVLSAIGAVITGTAVQVARTWASTQLEGVLEGKRA